MARAFGDPAPDVATLYRAANRVALGPNRILADEVTYDLHIGIRFELERQLFGGTLAVADLPEAWNAAYQRDLGLTITDPVEGVLQDVHWPSGGFGYFPSYTLGNLYAASLGAALESELPDLWDHVAAGRFAPVVDWLRDRIHRHGHRYEAAELVERAAGPRDAVDDLVDRMWARHGSLHGLSRG